MWQEDSGCGVVALESVECRNIVDESFLPYLASSMFSALHSLVDKQPALQVERQGAWILEGSDQVSDRMKDICWGVLIRCCEGD